jgi:hypothetical protein
MLPSLHTASGAVAPVPGYFTQMRISSCLNQEITKKLRAFSATVEHLNQNNPCGATSSLTRREGLEPANVLITGQT